MKRISDIVGNDIAELPDEYLCNLFIFVRNAYNEKVNEMIMACTIEFVKRTNRIHFS